MTAEHFYSTLRAFQRRAPFKSFIVEFISGDRVQVDHPADMVLRSGIAFFIGAAGVPIIFDHEDVSQVTDTAPSAA